MSQAIEAARQESSGVRKYLLAAYYFLTRSMSMTMALFGFLLTVFGVTVAPSSKEVFGVPLPTAPAINSTLGTLLGVFGIDPGAVWPSHQLISPMLVTWGGTLVLVGLVVFGVMAANRAYARVLRA